MLPPPLMGSCKELRVTDGICKLDIWTQANTKLRHAVDHNHINPKQGKPNPDCINFD